MLLNNDKQRELSEVKQELHQLIDQLDNDDNINEKVLELLSEASSIKQRLAWAQQKKAEAEEERRNEELHERLISYFK